MENPNYGTTGNVFNSGPQLSLPNATAVLILGIISIPTCCCGGLIGLICGVIALVLSNKDMALYTAAPGSYTTSSYNNLKAGRICAIIGIVFSSLYFILTIFMVATRGIESLSDPNAMKDLFQ